MQPHSGSHYAYLQWLKDRGLRYPTLLDRPQLNRSIGIPDIDRSTPDTLEMQPNAAMSEHPMPAGDSLKAQVLFVVDGYLASSDIELPSDEGMMTANERELLDRMIAAMHLEPQQISVHALMPGPLNAKMPPDASAIAQGIRTLLGRMQQKPPHLVVALGAWTCQVLLGSKAHFPTLRGKFIDSPILNNTPVLGTFHPRDLLRFPQNKRYAWQDLQTVISRAQAASTFNSAHN